MDKVLGSSFMLLGKSLPATFILQILNVYYSKILNLQYVIIIKIFLIECVLI